MTTTELREASGTLRPFVDVYLYRVGNSNAKMTRMVEIRAIIYDFLRDAESMAESVEKNGEAFMGIEPTRA